MAHSPSVEFNAGARDRLLTLARASIAHGCAGSAMPAEHAHLVAALGEPAFAQARNCFVTLLRDGALRGCIGSLSPSRPLAEDVARNAHSAAFRDPRFTAVTATELPHIEVQLSILSPQQPLAVASESELLNVLEPFVDGLTLEDGANRATFLPKVWEQLPDPAAFLQQLKAKAGLAPGHWSTTMRFWRYHAENFSETQQRRSAG
ncbi:MAG: AmmeMemoRadiSam system protein A [Gammaproteobacteria bacterium]|jgi:AmmeMemoRadiSam system protein A